MAVNKGFGVVAGRHYLNASGRTERRVVDVGPHVEFRWLGAGPAPKEDGVLYEDVRLGKTVYTDRKPISTGITSFRRWAHRMVPEGKETPV